MFEGRGKKWPGQELLVADEDSYPVVLDRNSAATKQVKGHTIGAEGLPHRKGDGNPLIVDGLLSVGSCN